MTNCLNCTFDEKQIDKVFSRLILLVNTANIYRHVMFKSTSRQKIDKHFKLTKLLDNYSSNLPIISTIKILCYVYGMNGL